MDLIKKIESSIEILSNPEEKVFNFDKEVELLKELKIFLEKSAQEGNIIDEYNRQVCEFKNRITTLMTEKGDVEKNYVECKSELSGFYALLQKEISGKMKILGYSEEEINKISDVNNFKELCEFRERILYEFDKKFAINNSVSENHNQPTIKFTEFKL